MRSAILPPKMRAFALRVPLLVLISWMMLTNLVSAASTAQPKAELPREEIFYQIFVRSFRDSNGDNKGDLKGIEEKLGYLQDLGITTLLLTPLYPSPFYHNYFADDFAGIDPAFGTETEFRQLVKSIHLRGMKLFLDQEMQYVSGNHAWFLDSFKKPNSKYSHYLCYVGPDNATYETGFWKTPEARTYDGRQVRIATVNLYEPAVQKYQTELFAHWMSPTSEGADDGVDGFRIDHMQDDLDDQGKLVNLFTRFWTPLFHTLKQTKPELRILAEQGDWGYGAEWLERGQADMVFGFPIRKAIADFNKDKLTVAVTETWKKTVAGKQQVIFIENHDTNRFASEAGGDLRKVKVGATLNLTLKGIPLIYYGQELGMTGQEIANTGSDGGSIPVREAFPWTSHPGPGMAVWYKDSGPWWNQSPLATGKGVSLEDQQKKSDSLFAYYRKLIALRQTHPALINGEQVVVENDSDHVFSFVRHTGTERVLIVVNLADKPITVHVNRDGDGSVAGQRALRDVFSAETLPQSDRAKFVISLPGYGAGVYEILP